jgi:hypothetical protein
VSELRFKKSREIAARAKRRRRRRVCDAPAKSYPRINQKTRTFVSPIAHTSVFSALSSILYVTYFTFPSRTLSNAGLQSSWGTTPELISFICVCVCTSYPKTTSDDKKKHTRVSLERIYESPSFLFRYACARVCVCVYIKSRARESSSRLCLFLLF